MKRGRFSVELVADSSEALRVAKSRGILPTALDTAGIREAFTQDVLERSVFSARNTNASVLRSIEKQVEKVLQGRDIGEARRILKGLITRAGYTPDRGFPGDAKLGIPPAMPGSIRDLGSNARIDLVLETQVAIVQGRAQQLAGMEPAALELYPAYELVRGERRRAPRDWVARWRKAGGKVRKDRRGRVRLVAFKDSEIWSVLGDPAFFPDAIGVSHPPFAWRSGMVWEDVSRAECVKLKLLAKDEKPKPSAKVKQAKPLPPVTASTNELSPRIRAALERGLERIEKSPGRISKPATAATDAFKPPPPPRSRAAELARLAREEFNALLEVASLF